jgi:hypothetical protein
MNIPDRLASVMIPEGPRVTSVADGKMANAATFTFLREDHTLGNMLRMCVCVCRAPRSALLPLTPPRNLGCTHAHPLAQSTFPPGSSCGTAT